MNCKICCDLLIWSRFGTAHCFKCKVNYYGDDGEMKSATYYAEDSQISLHFCNDKLSIYNYSFNETETLILNYKWNNIHPKTILEKILKMRSFL